MFTRTVSIIIIVGSMVACGGGGSGASDSSVPTTDPTRSAGGAYELKKPTVGISRENQKSRAYKGTATMGSHIIEGTSESERYKLQLHTTETKEE